MRFTSKKKFTLKMFGKGKKKMKNEELSKLIPLFFRLFYFWAQRECRRRRRRRTK